MTKQQKQGHIQRLVQQLGTLRQIHANLADLRQEAEDVGYAQDGPGALVEADLPEQIKHLGGQGYKDALSTLAELETVLSTPGAGGGPSLRARLRRLQP